MRIKGIYFNPEQAKFIEEIKSDIDCMNPKHCGCDRCPNCRIFYNKLKAQFNTNVAEKN